MDSYQVQLTPVLDVRNSLLLNHAASWKRSYVKCKSYWFLWFHT